MRSSYRWRCRSACSRPRSAIETVGLTPAAVVHVPPSVVTVVLVMNGNVRAVPFTVVIATTGAAVLMVIACAPLVPVFAAVSVCVAVTLYVPLAARVGGWCTSTRPRYTGRCRSASRCR